jgi:outer membrane protein TolC
MKNLVMAIAALGVLVGGAISGTCQQEVNLVTEALSLDQAIKIALKNNRNAKNAQLEVEKADDRVAQIRTRRLPSLKLNSVLSKPLSTFETNFEQGVFGTYPGIGPVPAENTSISSSTQPTALMIAQVSQPLTQLFRIGLQIKQQKVGVEISQANLRATEQSIVNEVKRAYYAILQTQGATIAAQESVKLYRELDRVTGQYVIQQVALKTEQMDVQTRLAKAEYQV